jgi:hypothetical protein
MVGNEGAAFVQFLTLKESEGNGAPAVVTIYLNSDSGGFSGSEWQVIAFDALGILVKPTSDPSTARFLPWNAIVGIT